MTELVAYVIFFAVLLTLAVVCCVCLDHFHEFIWRWRNPPDKLAAEKRELERRLLNPDWDFYEQHLQRPVPAALRELFENHDIILGKQSVEFVSLDDEDTTFISEFRPLDEQALLESTEYGVNAIPFAYGEGLFIYLRAGCAETDAVFSIWDELGSDSESELAPDVATFAGSLKTFDART